MTGHRKYCVLLDETVRNFPVAEIDIRTPFFTGKCEALCAENPAFDLILGNIPGVRGPNEPEVSWKTMEHVEESEVASAVQTRAQKKNRRKDIFIKGTRGYKQYRYCYC